MGNGSSSPRRPVLGRQDSRRSCRGVLQCAHVVIFAICLGLPLRTQAQTATPGAKPPATQSPEGTQTPAAPKTVEVNPTAGDAEITARIKGILQATHWFREPSVRVDEGVVFLEGRTTEEDYKQWAGKLAANTKDVVAVVNRISVTQRPVLDLAPAWRQLEDMGRHAIQALPLFGLGLVLLAVAWLLTRWSVPLARRLASRRIQSHLLQEVAARIAVVPVFILGVYVALRICGLTQVAVTVLGGTGLLGLIIGIAFRDITENFLASILISMQRPFEMGDMIKMNDFMGAVQSVTARGTVLMDLNGNHVQIPNATVYKSVIQNYAANPNLRMEFMVGIGYENSASDAQDVVMKVLKEHPAVLAEPEPIVLVDELASSTVNLRVYFWMNGREYNGFKVRSSIIRLTKRAIEKAGISMPDANRQVTFPSGLPVQILQGNGKLPAVVQHSRQMQERKAGSAESAAVDTGAEGGLTSEREEIQQQSRQSRLPEQRANLLINNADTSKASR